MRVQLVRDDLASFDVALSVDDLSSHVNALGDIKMVNGVVGDKSNDVVADPRPVSEVTGNLNALELLLVVHVVDLDDEEFLSFRSESDDISDWMRETRVGWVGLLHHVEGVLEINKGKGAVAGLGHRCLLQGQDS